MGNKEAVNERLAIRNARLVSALTEGYDGDQADLLIEDGRITGLFPVGHDFGSCDEIDAAGRTVLPGMLDLHTHLHFTKMDDLFLMSRKQNDVLLDCVDYAAELLRQGFTTIRDCGNPHYTAMAVRDGAERGLFRAPHILSCGYALAPTAPGNDDSAITVHADTPEEVLKAGRQQIACGADFLKYFGTGTVGSEHGVPGALLTTKPELQALNDTAEAYGKYAAVHCHSKAGILLCAEVGIRTIEHASDIDDECIERILSHGSHSAIIPTLGPIGLMRSGMLGESIAKKVRETSCEQQKMLEASRVGVLTGWGTDVSLDYYRSNPGSEFLLRKERGWTAVEMLEQATINSARIIGMDDDLGTIKAGKIADLVIVDGKPDEDIAVMTKYPWRILQAGKVTCAEGVIG